MNKKLLVSILIISVILFLGGISHAEELSESLKEYLANPSFDFLGHKYEKILFENNPTIIDDIKTMSLQLKCTRKIIVENYPTYMALGGLYGLKITLDPKEFGEMMFKLLKLAMK